MEQDTDVHLSWSNHQTTLLSVFSSLLDKGNLVDCTVGAEGQYFKAHRVILSACSPYFELLFSQHYEKHPVVILPDVKFHILKALMEFMYSGEVNIPQKQLNTVLKLAETLQIKGLSFPGESDMENDLRCKRRSESAIPSEQQGFTEYQHKLISYGTKVGQTEDGSPPLTFKNNCVTEITSLPLATNKCAKSNSNSIPTRKTIDTAVSQYNGDTEPINVFRSSSLTRKVIKSSTFAPETLLNSVSNSLDIFHLPGYSQGNVSKHSVSNENVLSTYSSGSVLGALEPQATLGKRPSLNVLPEVKQEAPDDFNGHTVEEIILDDYDDDGSDEYGDDNGATARDQYTDTYFEDPASMLCNLFRCEACGRSYRYRRGLSRHLKYECGKEPQFRCQHCPARFNHKYHLKVHVTKFHLNF